MSLPSEAEVLAEADRTVRAQGRVALCQLIRTEGSTPGRAGWKLLVRPDGSSHGNLGGGAFEAMVKRDAGEKLRESFPTSQLKRYYLTETASRGEATGMVCGGLVEVFLEVLMAKPLLLICGGGPVGQALAGNAALCDFDVMVVDDRSEFLSPELFPPETSLVEVDREYEGDFLEGLGGRELIVAVVSRCWETDLAAISGLFRQRPENLSYLGLMGSERKVERIVTELVAKDIDLRDEPVFRAPIGLPIGGETPGELAVSILGEIIQLRKTQRPEPDEPTH